MTSMCFIGQQGARLQAESPSLAEMDSPLSDSELPNPKQN